MLGADLTQLLLQANYEVIRARQAEGDDDCRTCDVADESAIQTLVSETDPEIVFNCAAYTNVDGAEEHEDLAKAINGEGAGNVARACKATDSFLVHVSTDYVFDGQRRKPYSPLDSAGPINAYGRSKFLGEERISTQGQDWAIVRTSWLFGPQGANFIKTITSLAQDKSELKVVNDQTGCPTYTWDLARCLIDLAKGRMRGVWHFCNGPACTWYDLAVKAVDLSGLNCRIAPCQTSEFPRPAERPVWSVMDCSKTFKALNWTARPWSEALEDYLTRV